jgi:hypothetical protein
LTPKVLQDIFKWAGVGEYGKRVKATATKNDLKRLPQRGIYLYFPAFTDNTFARVKCGTGTQFNILPVYSKAVEWDPNGGNVAPTATAYYALAIGNGLDADSKWVVFKPFPNPAASTVVLSEELRDESLFWTAKANPKFKRARIVMEKLIWTDTKELGRDPFQNYQLKLERNYIEDDDDEEAESSEVSLVIHPDYDDDLVSRWVLLNTCDVDCWCSKFTEFVFE